MQIILSSSSQARKKLLQRLQVSFTTAIPDVDETPKPQESVTSLVKRLAETKARKVAHDFPTALIIGSDQVVELKGRLFGKPGNKEAAFKQLQQMSGQAVNFITGLCVLNTVTNELQTVVEPFTVVFRQLSQATIDKYLELEQPYECAGSFRSEGLGIALCERFIGRDPTALEGLPLIQLSNLLAQEKMVLA